MHQAQEAEGNIRSNQIVCVHMCTLHTSHGAHGTIMLRQQTTPVRTSPRPERLSVCMCTRTRGSCYNARKEECTAARSVPDRGACPLSRDGVLVCAAQPSVGIPCVAFGACAHRRVIICCVCVRMMRVCKSVRIRWWRLPRRVSHSLLPSHRSHVPCAVAPRVAANRHPRVC